MASSHNRMDETARALRMSPWMVKNLANPGEKFLGIFSKEGILKCHRTDLAIKKSRGPKNLLMEKLVIDLCHPNKI